MMFDLIRYTFKPYPTTPILLQDRLVIVGAHWDTVPASPGYDDNASGVAAVLEVARDGWKDGRTAAATLTGAEQISK